MSAEEIADSTDPLRNIQNNNVRSLVASIGELAFDYCIWLMAVTWSAECKPSESSMED